MEVQLFAFMNQLPHESGFLANSFSHLLAQAAARALSDYSYSNPLLFDDGICL
jgi:hypothetical protein